MYMPNFKHLYVFFLGIAQIRFLFITDFMCHSVDGLKHEEYDPRSFHGKTRSSIKKLLSTK